MKGFSQILDLLGPGAVMDRSLSPAFLGCRISKVQLKGKHDAMVNSHRFIRTTNSPFSHSPRAGRVDTGNNEPGVKHHGCFMRSVGGKEGAISQRLWVIGVFIISGYETRPFEILVVLSFL